MLSNFNNIKSGSSKFYIGKMRGTKLVGRPKKSRTLSILDIKFEILIAYSRKEN